jgi:hypothetical protein
MEHLALVCIGLVIGFSLGVIAMALFSAPGRDTLPEPRSVPTPTVRASGSELRELSWADGMGSHRSPSVVGIAVPTHTVSGTKERDFT